MTDIQLSDEDWSKMRECLRQESRASRGRDEPSCRRFLDAVKWISRSGAEWRLLQARVRRYDTWLDRERQVIEGCFNKLKHVRPMFSRFEQLDRALLGFLHFCCTLLWVR